MWRSRTNMFIQGAWRSLPVETLVVAMAAVGAIGGVHDHTQVVWQRLLFAGVLLTPLAFAAHRLGRRMQALAIGVAAVGVLAALAVGLNDVHDHTQPAFSWPYFLTLLGALLAPFVAAAGRFTRFVRRFLEETTTWGLLWLCALVALV